MSQDPEGRLQQGRTPPGRITDSGPRRQQQKVQDSRRLPAVVSENAHGRRQELAQEGLPGTTAGSMQQLSKDWGQTA